jgi:hypothetical protein
MKQNPILKISSSILLYAIVLYYLLPFRPAYLYYSAHHNQTQIVYELNKDKANPSQNNITFTSDLKHNKDTFPQKDKVRFFFTSCYITTPFITKFVFYNVNQNFPFLQSSYQNPLILFNSGRGPPIV